LMRSTWRFICCLLILVAQLLTAANVQAGTLAGRVVGVTDGDTITVLDSSNRQYKIRFAGIDAPEKNQPFGQRAKEHLSELVFNRQVIVETEKEDRYGRTVGKVLVSGRDTNLAMVVAGYAWHYKKYQAEQSPDDRLLYDSAEQEARAARRGLWEDPDPIPPSEWRAGKKQ
jgi:endonuclease YncB( thermonuclease family)